MKEFYEQNPDKVPPKGGFDLKKDELDESGPLVERLVDQNHEIRYNAYEEQRVIIMKKKFNDTSLDEIAPKFEESFLKDKTLNNFEKALELF